MGVALSAADADAWGHARCPVQPPRRSHPCRPRVDAQRDLLSFDVLAATLPGPPTAPSSLPITAGCAPRGTHRIDVASSLPPSVSTCHEDKDTPPMTAGVTSAARKPARPRKGKGEGQWALGYREPLNKNEENKKNDDGLNVRARIENIYAHDGFDSIDPADLRGRFRWWGLYTQRKPGIDGGKTATLEPEELDDRYFMLRVRIDGGLLTSEQLRVIAGISRDYARGTADVTDRQNIQLHWIEIESVPAIWEALESVGLDTTEACGDTPRVVLGCPLAGVDADEVIDATPQIAAINERFIGDTEFSNLPRKFKTSVSGCPGQCTHHEINDVAFAGVRHPVTGEVGYDLWVGGGLSTNPMLAKRLGVFVKPGQVP